MMFPAVFQALSTPFSPDTPNTVPFWDDDHISLQRLAAHLDPTHDLASRKPKHRVTGIDLSQRSIEYARIQANKEGLLEEVVGFPGVVARRFVV